MGLARGELVWIAEADDFCDPSLLEKLVPAFNRADVVLSYCQSKQIDERDLILSNDYLDYVADIDASHWTTSFVEDGHYEISNSLYIKNTIPNVSGVIFRKRDLLEVLVEFREDIDTYRFAGDWMTYLRLLERGAVSFTKDSLNFHRRHSSSVTLANHSIDLLREIARVQSDTIERFDLGPAAKSRADQYIQVLMEQFGLGADEVLGLADHPNINGRM